MIIGVASGKGGTGKTTVAVNLALALGEASFLDCDVENPNAHLFLKPRISEMRRVTVTCPEIDLAKCSFCGTCQSVCAYHAITVIPPKEGRQGTVLTFPHLCRGCGGCKIYCPTKAIREVQRDIGVIELGCRNHIDFAGGRLNIGETRSPHLIAHVKQCLNGHSTGIIDAPPGTSCPMIAAIKDCDYVLLVTEDTPFGLHDLELAMDAARASQIPFGVVLNRSGTEDNGIKGYCYSHGVPFLMDIPYDKGIAESQSDGIPMVESNPEYKAKFLDLYHRIEKERGV